MYQAAMSWVEGQKQPATAKHALTWLFYALWPLSIEALQYAIAIDPETFKFKPELLSDNDTLISLCCSLITVEPESKQVQLVHECGLQFSESDPN